MIFASWNVNSIKARLEHVKTWLRDNKPDVLMLQELKSETFPHEDFKALGYDALVVGQKAYNGVATLTRHPATLVSSTLPGDDEDTQARYIEAQIGDIRCINIYLPNGNPVDSEKYPYKLRWMDRLHDRLRDLRQPGAKVLVAGDFNVIPEAMDCYDPAAWANDALFLPRTRQAYRRIINLGYTEAFRALNAGGGHYTFWDYQAGAWQRNNGIRIDHILLSPALADGLQSCTIDKTPRGAEKASDHTPILASLST